MKMVSLLATAAAVALIAGSASAQAVTETSYVNPANAGNAGTIAESLEATFSITASVDASCVLGNGDENLDDVNFGVLGIYGDAAAGVDSAFEMVGANSNGNSSTNAAGCNTANRLTLTKTNGLLGLVNEDADDIGYDDNVFQANIPYSLGANYVAGNPGSIGTVTSLGKFTVSTTESTDFRENNAWRSSLGIRVDIPAAAKALVAGTYSDTVTVLIEVI
jgi:Spore Coat Protein U domain